MNQKYSYFLDQRVENKNLPFYSFTHFTFTLHFTVSVITESKTLFNTSYYLEKLLFYRKK